MKINALCADECLFFRRNVCLSSYLKITRRRPHDFELFVGFLTTPYQICGFVSNGVMTVVVVVVLLVVMKTTIF